MSYGSYFVCFIYIYYYTHMSEIYYKNDNDQG